MHHSPFEFAGRSRLTGLYFVCAAAAVVGGCAVTPPDVPADIALATRVQNAIVFRHEPEPFSEPGGSAALLREEAIRQTLSRDPRLQIALAQVRMAEADANQARLFPNPVLNIDLRYPHASGSNTVFEATLTGDLVALLQKPAQISAADKRLRASASAALITALDVMREVQEAYVAVQNADAQIENAQSREKILQQLREIAQKRLDLGEGTRLDLLTLDAQLLNARIDFADLQQIRHENRLSLAKLMGQPRGAAEWQLSAWEAPPTDEPGTEAAWIDAALQHRPEIQTKLFELKALGDDLTAAAFSPFVGGDVGVHTEHDPEWRTGPSITLPLPIFDWGQASRAKLQAQRIAARHELAGTEADIIQDIRVSYSDYLHTRGVLADAQQKLLPMQQQQHDLARNAYQSGDADLATLLLAQTDLQQTFSKIMDLQQKVSVARIKLQRAAGGAAVAERLEASAQPATSTVPSTAPTSQPATGRVP